MRSLSRKADVCLFIAVLIFAVLPACAAEPAEPVAAVTWLKGDWRFEVGDGSSPLSGGQELPAGARLYAGSENASLRIAFLDGKSGVTYTRSGSHPDPSGILLGALVTEPQSMPRRFLDAMGSLLGMHRPITYRSGQIGLEDAVIAWRQDQPLDLAPVFAAAFPGNYEVVLQTWVEEPAGPGWRRVGILPYRWQPEDPAPIEVPGLAPGLLRLQVTDPQTATPGEAWVLLSPPSSFADHSQAFRQFHDQIPWWGGDPDTPEVQSLLRAFLHSLARELAEGQTTD